MDSSTTSSGNNENHLILNNSSSMGPSTKKRKLSMGEMSSTNIELEILRSTTEKWKQYAQKLESEKREHIDECSAEKNLELEDTVEKLQSLNAELITKHDKENHQLKTEMKSSVNEYTAKIKILETKIQELTDEISSMKNIKMEIKDSVEAERETCQTEIQILKAEIKTLKDKNYVLEKKAQEAESKFLNSENKYKEMDKKYGETTVANQTLEQKCKELEATINKNKKEYQSTNDELKTENQELKNRIEILENNECEKFVSLDEASNGSKLDFSLLSCKLNIIMNVSKIEGSSPDGWKLYSTLNESEKPRLLTEKDMMETCFKMNITDQFMASKPGPKFQHIMSKINICELTKLELNHQKIDFQDYLKLVSSRKVQICIISFCIVLKEQNNEKCEMDELLMHLPNITEFKYCCDHLIQNFSSIAKNLGKLDKFRNLKKFEILSYFDSFNLEDMDGFIKKNDIDVSYLFTFRCVQKSLQSKIKDSQKKLLKALPLPYNIQIELQQ